MHYLLSLLALLLMAMPLSSKADVAAALQAYKNQQYPLAEQLLQSALEQGNPSATMYLYLAKTALKRERLDDAETHINQALQLTKIQDHATLAQVNYWQGRIMERQAEASSIFSVTSKAKKALQGYQTAVQLQPDEIQFRIGLMHFYLDAPGLAGGDTQKALAQAEIIFAKDSNAGFKALIDCYKKLDEEALLLNTFTKALAQYPNDVELYQKRALYWLTNKQSQKAAADFSASASLPATTEQQQAIQLFSMYQLALLSIKTEQQLGEGVKALQGFIANYRTADEVYTPPLDWARYRLANLYELQQNDALAKKLYQEISLTTGDSELLAQLKERLEQLVKKLPEQNP